MMNDFSAPAQIVRQHAGAVRAGVRVEQATIGWMAVEAVVAIGAGLLARSVLLTAFGLDSVIELLSGGVLLWRLATEARGSSLEQVERAENRAAWITGSALVLLCLYVVVSASVSLWTHSRPAYAPAGMVIALLALVGMPVLARRKRAIAASIDSAALRGDAACSITCAYMAGALVAGLVLTRVAGWWWADSVAALALLYWLGREAHEVLAGARAGHGACACDG